MVIFGGLEFIAGAYFLNEYSRSKRRQREGEEEESRRTSRRRRHSHDGQQRPSQHHKYADRPHTKNNRPLPQNGQRLPQSSCSKPPQSGLRPPTQHYRPGSAPLGFVPQVHGVRPGPWQQSQNPGYVREEDRYLVPNHYPPLPLLPNQPQQAVPGYPPASSNPVSPVSPRPSKSAAITSQTPHSRQRPSASHYVPPPPGVFEMPTQANTPHPNPAILGRTRASSRTARPHVHFEEDVAPTYSDEAPPPYSRR